MYCYGNHPVLNSFPTRRSSDLSPDYHREPGLQVSATGPVPRGLGRLLIIFLTAANNGSDPWSMDSSLLSRNARSEEHTSELQSPYDLVCRLLLEKKKTKTYLYH